MRFIIHNFSANFATETSFSSSDIIAIIAIVVSLISLAISGLFIYLSKRLEIKYEQFDRLCIQNINKILNGLDALFEEKTNEPVECYRSQITNTVVELQLFLTTLRSSCYQRIDLERLISYIDNFTEDIYKNKEKTFVNFKGDYYSLKILLTKSLYGYASSEVITISVSRVFRNWCARKKH